MQQMTLNAPLYIWAIVATLALVWIWFLLPDRFKSAARKPAPSRYVQLSQDLDVAGASAPAKVPAAAHASNWTLDLLRSLNSEQLTEVIHGFWQARVCNVEITGKDMLIHRPSTGRLFGVAHRMPSSGEKVGLDAVRALWELVQSRQAPLGLFYGLSGFAPEALAFAKDKPLKLLMGSDLLVEIGHLRAEQQQELMARLTHPVRAAA